MLMVLVGLIAGCGNYQLRGKVVQGQMSLVTFVPDDDERLNDRGLGGATVLLRRDPTKGWAKDVASVASDGEGGFLLDVGEFGAGWMKEQWMIRARRKGFEDAETVLTLPTNTKGSRLLIILAPGETSRHMDDPWKSDDLMKQYEQYR